MQEENKDIVSIDFYDKQLTAIKKDGDTYVVMRPIVEGIGLNWGAQQQKFAKNKKKFSCIVINTTGKDNKQYQMLCIPLKKLNGYLFSINPERVRKDIKNKVVLYQEECFKSLHDYFNNGYALDVSQLSRDETKLDALSRE